MATLPLHSTRAMNAKELLAITGFSILGAALALLQAFGPFA